MRKKALLNKVELCYDSARTRGVLSNYLSMHMMRTVSNETVLSMLQSRLVIANKIGELCYSYD